MEHGSPIWLTYGFIYLTAAVLAVPIARALGLGAIIGYLGAGIAMGPGVLAWCAMWTTSCTLPNLAWC
jgi:Kef-type K+ transport system membrane component KefB